MSKAIHKEEMGKTLAMARDAGATQSAAMKSKRKMLGYYSALKVLLCVSLMVLGHDCAAVSYTVSKGLPEVIRIAWTPVSGAVSYNIYEVISKPLFRTIHEPSHAT